MTTPTVSVVIPTRNRRALLKEAVESVERQTLQHWELVIVDDASDDGTWAWLSSVADPRVRVIRQDAHAERSAARNRGLAEANGRFILFLDDDDRLFPKALERLARALERRPHVVASVGARVAFDVRGQRRRHAHPRVPLLRDVRAEAMFWVAAPGQTLIRSSALIEIGGWDERLTYAEDHDLWLRLSRLGPVAVVPLSVLEYRHHDGQWPREADETVQGIRVRALAACESPEERRRAQRTFDASVLAQRASECYRQRKFSHALRLYGAVGHVAPWLVSSPLVGPALVSTALKCIVFLPLRSPTADRLVAARRAARRLLRRGPQERGTLSSQSLS